ncbi:hypothetical protein BACCOPRO_01921 [Phocaeicola coprophilus DSM 18228 = JCM 13818]|uniref:Uncharacterized protein n=1 Tax=Phocaeicola coprophilus DSM 18228 = JCM 13818 TaxID=547042 RepID=S0FDA8_9BACT|nr:hypothetical protein BACCOPRO_01921 [Phocaeicola coprophilus DSM 18228 = JCM 13818]
MEKHATTSSMMGQKRAVDGVAASSTMRRKRAVDEAAMYGQ